LHQVVTQTFRLNGQAFTITLQGTARCENFCLIGGRAECATSSRLPHSGQRFRFLIRDRDAKFTTNLTPYLPPSVPRAFALLCVRLVRTHTRSSSYALSPGMPRPSLVVSRRHLESVIAQYVRHDNQARPHRGLQLVLPIPHPVSAPDRDAIIPGDILGVVADEYERAA
jgi:putative transposase